MKRDIPRRTDLIYNDIKADTTETGRFYHTPKGLAPSVTTVLSIIPQPYLDQWRRDLGEKEADRRMNEAATIGTCMHDRLEAYINKTQYVPSTHKDEEKIAALLEQAIKVRALGRLNEIWGVEVALYLQDLFAGRTDLVGIYDGKPSIIDYKNARYIKPDHHLEKYKMQLAAYAMAHDEMFKKEGIVIEQGVNIIGVRPNNQFRQGANVQISIIGKKDLDYYKDEFLKVVETYHLTG